MSNLLDTDWAISYLNRVPRTVHRVDALLSAGIAISIVSVAELYEGTLNSYDPERDERILSDFLRPFPIIDLDILTCRIFGIERARLRTAGNLIPDMDLLIGATALRHNFTRLTGLSIISL